MTTYGILLVEPSWSNKNTAQIEKAAFLRHQNLLGTDTKALIYMREPIDAVVAEAEITSDVIETEAELLNHTEGVVKRDSDDTRIMARPPLIIHPGSEVAHDFRVPLKLLRSKGPQTPPIPLSKLKTLLGSDFSVYDETWIPLGEDQYNEIIALWTTQ